MTSVMDVDAPTLGYVLKDFKLIDMIAVAFSYTHLHDACRYEFSRRYAKKEIILRLIEITPGQCDETDDKVVIYSLKFILQCLRFFGSLIKNVTIEFFDRSIEAAYIVKYLCRYCSFSLKKICFQNLSFDVIQFFNRSFLNVEEMVFVSCILSQNFKHSSLFFPNVKIMNFYGWNTFCSYSEFCEDLVGGCEFFQSFEKSGIIICSDD